MSHVTVRPFQPRDAVAFRLLNEEWIEHYFTLEPKDREVLSYPQRNILDKGGRIFVAEQDGVCVGCCALVQMGDGEYELAKMAVSPTARRGGIGRKLMATAIAWADAAGVTRLYLETNHVLEGAIALYESMGFHPVPPERLTSSVYVRADVFMERLMLLPAMRC